jgi:signal transduction histidine kinase
MLSDKLKFTKTLRFKLTLWYSILLTVFCIVFVLGINIWLNAYISKNPILSGYGPRGIMNEQPFYRNFTEEQRNLIIEARLEDFDYIKSTTLYALIPLTLLSFVGGYVIADFALKPLNKLNKQMKSKSTDNLGESIEYVDHGDEISQLIESFNRMSRRLNREFNAQKEFVENASHELKTPLSVIQANLDNALEDNKITKKELKQLLESAKKNVKFMDNLTEDLLLLSVLEQQIAIDEVDVKKVLNESIKLLNSKITKKKIKIVKDYPKSKVIVKANESLLQRAFMNIIENAIKYSGCKQIELKINKQKEYIEILIGDDGIGIPQKFNKKIFERFSRLDKSRSRSTGGTGLGLAITKKIINRFNGEIYLKSEVSKGAVFVIKIHVN